MHIGQQLGQQPEQQPGPQPGLQVGQRPGPNTRQKARRKARQQAKLQAELQAVLQAELQAVPQAELQAEPRAEPQAELHGPSGRYFISQQLKAKQELHKAMIKVMDWLQGQCIYCTLMYKGLMGESITGGLGSQGQLHEYNNCFNVEADRCGYVSYLQWRLKVFFKKVKHC